MIFAAVPWLTAAINVFFLVHFPIYCCEYKKTAANDEQQIQFFSTSDIVCYSLKFSFRTYVIVLHIDLKLFQKTVLKGHSIS